MSWRLLGERVWKARFSSGAAPSRAPTFVHIDWVGVVPRWTRFKPTWRLDTDWLDYRKMSSVDRKQLAFKPSERSLDIETARIEDYDRPPPEIDRATLDLLAEAVKWAQKHFAAGKTNKVMTIDEAIEFVKKSDPGRASPGYPLNQRFKTKALALADPEVVADLKLWFSKLGTHEVESILMSLSLKDEILKTTKIDAKKTRLFMAMPLYHHVAMVALFQNVQDQIFESRSTWTSAGRAFQYGGWHDMMEWIEHMSRKFGADAVSYDMSIERFLFSAFLEVMLSMLPGEYHAIIIDLFAMALDGFIVTSRGFVYQKHTGNPSGWFLTLLLNTIVMYMLLAITWMRVFPDSDQAEFERLVRAWLIGDDSLVGTHVDIDDDFTSARFTETWALFGIQSKEPEHVGTSIANIEYCGATSVRIYGRWARVPRVRKFLDALLWTRTKDPQYRLMRAASILTEMWPVPEKEIVQGYIEYLVRKYKYLAPLWRALRKTESEMAYLHLGLEGSPIAVRNGDRDKNSSHGEPAKDSYLVTRNAIERPDFIPQGAMPKKSKESKAAARAVGYAELAKLSPTASAAAQAGALIAKRAKSQKKKKKTGFWDIVSGAAKTAAELAPIVAPLILANHGPTALNAQNNGVSAVASGVPLAQTSSCSTCTGCYSMKASLGKDGRVTGAKLRGMDFLGALYNNGPAIGAGTVMKEINLNPYDTAWDGTQLQRYASLYERYRPKRIAFIVEPACAATTAGQIIAYVDPDPDDEFTLTGNAAVQAASSHQGADVSQVWQMNVAGLGFDAQTQDFFADADGSDERLISPGIYRVMANTTIGENVGTLGSIYCCWEYEFKLTQLGEAALGGAFAIADGSDPTPQYPLGQDNDWDELLREGNLSATLVTSAGSQYITGLKPGFYEIFAAVTGAPASTVTFSCDGENYYQTEGSGTITGDSTFSISTTNFKITKFSLTVGIYSTDFESAYLGITGTGGNVTNFSFFIARVTQGVTVRRRKTLQQYEDDMETLKTQVAQMRELLMTLPPEALMPHTSTSGATLFSAALAAARR